MFNAACSRLRLGGGIAGSVLSGGTTIDTGGIAISSWAGMLGFSGYSGFDSALIATDGQYHRTGKAVRAKTVVLNFRAYGRDATGVVTTSIGEHLDANLDAILELVAAGGEQAILERDMTDGSTRWIRLQAQAAGSITPGPLFGNAMGSYDLPFVMTAAYPYWQSETLHSQVVTPGADTIVNAGNARISNATLTFAGAGSFTNDDTGDVLTTTAACIVDIGERSITAGGVPTPGRLAAPAADYWFRLGAGTTNVTGAVANVTVGWRDHWH